MHTIPCIAPFSAHNSALFRAQLAEIHRRSIRIPCKSTALREMTSGLVLRLTLFYRVLITLTRTCRWLIKYVVRSVRVDVTSHHYPTRTLARCGRARREITRMALLRVQKVTTGMVNLARTIAHNWRRRPKAQPSWTQSLVLAVGNLNALRLKPSFSAPVLPVTFRARVGIGTI